MSLRTVCQDMIGIIKQFYQYHVISHVTITEWFLVEATVPIQLGVTYEGDNGLSVPVSSSFAN